MSRHVLDRPRTHTATRAQKFLEAARREGLHPAALALHRRPRPLSGSRMLEFLRIDRMAHHEARQG